MSIHLLQTLTAVLWFMTAFVVAPGTYRIFFGTIKRGDTFKSASFFAALIFVGQAGRWLFAPDAILVWKLLYGMSLALALYVWVIVWNMRRDS